LILAPAPGSAAPVAIAPVLAVIGGVCGALGGAEVGGGLSLAEAGSRSVKAVALVSGASLGGGLAGLAVQWIARWSLEALVGVRIGIGGMLEGFVIRGAAGIGCAIATREFRRYGGASRPPVAACRRDHRDGVRAGRARPFACRTAARQRHHSCDCRAGDGSRATLDPLGR